ncbi:hypothetical protein J6590_046059 [Homalodisca vitripennis]|nr:hypothetical protein J6590_046059 [Homalodisca vitripennis]
MVHAAPTVVRQSLSPTGLTCFCFGVRLTNYEFLLQLNNVELPLDERLHIAHGALISQEFPLPGKEQVIIDWFAHCLKVNSSHPKGTMKKLIKCMKSDRLLTFCDAVDASKLIEVCIALDEDIKHRYSRLLVKLVLLLLKMPSFQRYCRFDILPMTQVMGLACDLLSRMDGSGVSLDDSTATESDEDLVTTGLEDLFSSILNIHKVTQQRDELKLRFVKTILPAILKLRFHFKNSTQFHILLEELIIGEDINTLCIAFKYYGKNETRHIPEYLKAIVKYIAQDDAQCDVITLNSVIFDVYVQTCLKLNETTTNHLTLFYILATRVGFKLELPYEVPIACNGSGPTLLVLGELVAVLQKYNISASTESEEGTLSNYLVVILKQLISEQYQMSADFLRTVYSIFQVYPESVKLVFFEFAKHIMFVSKENYEVSSVYDSLIEEVIKIYADLNQIEKFLSSFFHKAFLLQKEQDFRKLTCSTVLSNGVFKVFSEKLPSLTGNQLKTIIGRLEKIFLKNCIHVLESDSVIDSSFCLNVEMLVKVICFVLDNSCIAMPTRWNTLSEEISRLVLSVQRFGVAVLKSREIELLKGFLDLVRATAGIEMMMNQYVISLSSIKLLPTVKSVDKSGSVLNLARSHGYLTPPDWKRISELVVEFDDQQLNYCWVSIYYITTINPFRTKHRYRTAGGVLCLISLRYGINSEGSTGSA